MGSSTGWIQARHHREGYEGTAPPPGGVQRGWDQHPGGGSRQGGGTEHGAQLSLLPPAERPHHAQEKMREEDLSQWDTLVVMSGDGLLHEVRGAGWGTELGGEGCRGQERSSESCRQEGTAKGENPGQAQPLSCPRLGAPGSWHGPGYHELPPFHPCRW